MIVTFLDPTTGLGPELVGALAQAHPEVGRRLAHTRSNEHLLLEMAGDAAVVGPLRDPDELGGSTVVVVTSNPGTACRKSLLAWIEAHPRVAVLDLSPSFLVGRTTTRVAARPFKAGQPRWVRPPDSALLGPLRLIEALGPVAPEEAVLTLLVPASDCGDEGITELATQAAARLTGARPQHTETLGRVLAFDLVPDGPRRTQAAAQIAAMLPNLKVRLHVVATGVFHGHAATVDVRCAGRLDESRVRTLVRENPGLVLTRAGAPSSPTDAVEHNKVLCSHVEVAGGWVSAWLAYDGNRLGGAHAAFVMLSELLATTAAKAR